MVGDGTQNLLVLAFCLHGQPITQNGMTACKSCKKENELDEQRVKGSDMSCREPSMVNYGTIFNPTTSAFEPISVHQKNIDPTTEDEE